MLAMDVNDDAGCLNAPVVWTFIASMLAPTGGEAGQLTRLSSPGSPPTWTPRSSPGSPAACRPRSSPTSPARCTPWSSPTSPER
ncbi:hypothetical protein F6476_10315 [Pseudomonas umsongensis]|nr:hypothetical protein F6476_10315 [Pseudomonas umsongensis]